MSINNCILKTLNLKDQNIKFSEDFLEERIIKDIRCLIYKGLWLFKLLKEIWN